MIRCPATDDSFETYRYDKFVGPVTIRNEVGFYVWSEGEILPVGMCPLCYQDKSGAGGTMRRHGVLGIADTTESSELTEGPSVSPIRALLTA